MREAASLGFSSSGRRPIRSGARLPHTRTGRARRPASAIIRQRWLARDQHQGRGLSRGTSRSARCLGGLESIHAPGSRSCSRLPSRGRSHLGWKVSGLPTTRRLSAPSVHRQRHRKLATGRLLGSARAVRTRHLSGDSTRATLKRRGPGPVRVGRHARGHRLRAVSQAVRAGGL